MEELMMAGELNKYPEAKPLAKRGNVILIKDL